MNGENYGVCRLALVQVKAGPDDRAGQVTQLLFGDHYEVLEYSANGLWLYIKIFNDGQEGWIAIGQHHAITREYFSQINQANFKITMDLTAGILYKKNPITILLGSIVPISNSELFKMEEQFAFNGEAKSLGQKREFEFLKSIANKYLHAPNQGGGKSPFGIDASGLTQMVFKICGYPIPRDARQQAHCGTLVEGHENAKPGDLAFFHDGNGDMGHVGIILEEAKVIHASGSVRIDHLHEGGIVSPDGTKTGHWLSAIRRVLAS